MRKPLDIPPYLIDEARLFAPGRADIDAVCHVLSDYPRLVAETRQMRRKLLDLDREQLDFDSRLQALQVACQAILDL
jgi:hypothetical protein